MSKIKLVVQKRNAFGYGEVTESVLTLQNGHKILGIVETDFEPEEDGSVRSNDGLDPVITVDNINYLVGQLLTLVEAGTADPEQRKAAKDLYKQTVWSWYTHVTETLQRTWRYDKGYETDNPKTSSGVSNSH